MSNCFTILLLLFSTIALILVSCTSRKPDQTLYYLPNRFFRSFLLENGYAVRTGFKYLTPTDKVKSTTFLNCFNKKYQHPPEHRDVLLPEISRLLLKSYHRPTIQLLA